MNSLAIPDDFRKELKVSVDGEVTISQRGLARLAGVDPKSIREVIKKVSGEGPYGSKMLETLAATGFQAGNKINDVAVVFILGYYAYQAGRYCTEQAQISHMSIAAVGFRSWAHELLGWEKESNNNLERLKSRQTLKTKSRVYFTDSIKYYLESIGKYDSKKSGYQFAKYHDLLNLLLTGETSIQMRQRLSQKIGREVKQDELIRDWFPQEFLEIYNSSCMNAANLILRYKDPEKSIREGVSLAVTFDYKPMPIDFDIHIDEMKKLSGKNQKFLK